MLALDPEISFKVQTVQLIEDAIAYREGRSAAPCPDCRRSAKCDDHEQDIVLTRSYQARHDQAFAAALECMNPADVRQALGEEHKSRTAAELFGVAMLGRLREIAADGAVWTELAGRDVIIELDGDQVIEHLLSPDDVAVLRASAQSGR